MLNGSKPDAVAKAADELRAEGHSVHEAPFDVTDEAAIVAAFQNVDAQGVAVDILVNNAGVQYRKPIVELDTADWRRVIDINLTSAFIIAREAAKRMIPRKRGKIINIGSLMCDAARATVAPYTGAKGGLKMLTRTMSAEWAVHNIQANTIGPGYMLTEMNQALVNDEEFNAWVIGGPETPVPLNTVVAKEISLRGTFRFDQEFAWAVHFIASGAIDVRPLLTDVIPLNDAVRAFELAGDRSRAMKVQLAL